MFEFLTSLHWSIIIQVVCVDIVLGGDNAILISLACRNLPAKQQIRGLLFGTAGAIFLRIILITFAISLLNVPLLKFFGGVMLLLIGVKLIRQSKHVPNTVVKSSEKLWSAVRTIIVADTIMSIDNVIAIAGVAEQTEQNYRIALIVFGLIISIPIIVLGSIFMLKLFDPFPKIASFGAALLGWIGGGLIVSDPTIANLWLMLCSPRAICIASIVGALFVLTLGYMLKRTTTH